MKNEILEPNTKYVKDRADLKQILLDNGSTVFRHGELWEIKKKNIGLGVYEVWLEIKKAVDKS